MHAPDACSVSCGADPAVCRREESTVSVHQSVARYYADRLRRFGSTPAGVDWRDGASQHVRFEQLWRVVSESDSSVIDLGCGYGALVGFLEARGFSGTYLGVDVSAEMIDAARRHHGIRPNVSFEVGSTPSRPADYLVASGIFNVKQTLAASEWEKYVLRTLNDVDRVSLKGFAFNCLTSYSDPHLMRDDLFYADPGHYFDLCKRRYSGQVALLHDYGLYEFTIIVRKR